MSTGGKPLKPETAKVIGEIARAGARHIMMARGRPRNGSANREGRRAVLAAIAQCPKGVERQLTVLIGYKKTSRDAYIARLRDRGYIDVLKVRTRTTRLSAS